MARDRKDRSENWFMNHHGGSLLWFAKLKNVVRWQPVHTVLGFPKQVPDGLLDVTFAGTNRTDPFLIEIEAYPVQDTLSKPAATWRLSSSCATCYPTCFCSSSNRRVT